MPTRKKARKSATRPRSKKKRKPQSRRTVRKRTTTAVAVGDVVRLPANARNQLSRYEPRLARVARGADAVEGIVCSIRDISTGRLTAKTRGDLDRYVLDVLHHRTFTAHFSSDRNTGGPKGSDQLRDNPSWVRLRALLREAAAEGHFLSAASGELSRDLFSSLLDGWRVVKVRAELIDIVE